MLHDDNDDFFNKIKKDIPLNVYTDGACHGNPGKGGWGVFMLQEKLNLSLSGSDGVITTNNRMEMMAAIKALEIIPDDFNIILHTDSQYLKNGITTWIINWKKKGWKTADGKPVKNQDLWQRLDVLCIKKSPKWKWIKGHDGQYGNEKADELAGNAVK